MNQPADGNGEALIGTGAGRFSFGLTSIKVSPCSPARMVNRSWAIRMPLTRNPFPCAVICALERDRAPVAARIGQPHGALGLDVQLVHIGREKDADRLRPLHPQRPDRKEQPGGHDDRYATERSASPAKDP